MVLLSSNTSLLDSIWPAIKNSTFLQNAAENGGGEGVGEGEEKACRKR